MTRPRWSETISTDALAQIKELLAGRRRTRALSSEALAARPSAVRCLISHLILQPDVYGSGFWGTNREHSYNMDVNQNDWSSTHFTKSNICLTAQANKSYTLKDKLRSVIKTVKNVLKETTVEPCLFLYMFSMAVSSIAVQNIHLEKSCRVNYDYPDEICDRIMARDTKGLEGNLEEIQTLVAKVMSWKFILQTAIPAVMVLFVGAWSDRTKKRKICILFPMTGELVKNIGLILDTYYMQEWSLDTTAFIEALPMALTGSYIIIFMGMFSYMTDITTVEERTFRLGIVTICVTLGTPTGTALSGILLHAFGYYGVFFLVFFLNLLSLTYGMLRLEDVVPDNDDSSKNETDRNESCLHSLFKIWQPVYNTVMIALKKRPNRGRFEILLILLLYFLMVLTAVHEHSKRKRGQQYVIGPLGKNPVERNWAKLTERNATAEGTAFRLPVCFMSLLSRMTLRTRKSPDKSMCVRKNT
ncbi:hypothetical protein EVAR_81026_1 [Eumeta japonica]|uniref:Solute carrier family 46 member 3 n=1 Tax=Eumeta variegata TaxID=151549 RepID=A0A4C1T5Q7_EUMVA|nr:hypothetical protein EVAR_81026_1 [Eumeta japonica]